MTIAKIQKKHMNIGIYLENVFTCSYYKKNPHNS